MDINELYKQAISGNQNSEKQLFDYLSDSFRLFVRQKVMNREDGEDIVQKVLTSIAKHYKNISIETGFSAWAYKIFENEIKDYYRWKESRSAREVSPERIEDISGSLVPDPELTRKLISCYEKIAKVNPQYSKILRLRYQGYGINEICDMLKMTKNAVYLVLSRARYALRKCLEEKGPI